MCMSRVSRSNSIAYLLKYHRRTDVVLFTQYPAMAAPTPMDPTELAEIAVSYHMEGQEGLVQEWLQHCDDFRYYAQAFVLEGVYQERGLFVVNSTPESTRAHFANVRMDELHERILNPEYFQYDVWFYPKVVLLNWRGCTYGGMLVGKFENLLDSLCMSHNIPDWKQRYAPKAGEAHNQNLGRLLGVCGIKGFMKITVGLSMRQFRCLDVYTRLQMNDAPLPDYEAWDIVGVDVLPASQRRVPEPHEWWYYAGRFSYGQRSIVAEWHLGQPSELRILCDRYAVNQMEVLRELFIHCDRDPDGLYRVLRAMCMSPSMGQADPRMEPLKEALLTTSTFRGIPRAIEDKKAQQITRRSRM